MPGEKPLREPFAYIRQGRGSYFAFPWVAFVFGAFLIAAGAGLPFVAARGMSMVIPSLIGLLFVGLGGVLLWIGTARLRWKYAYRERYGYFPAMGSSTGPDRYR
ncbi:hypothetical protein [Psychromicrobium xiongbiense]|uniref:hypothetical protein n=1 Tax=Psychromicrobium xiongbiense TaxID=3051184 RepID=UPI002557C5B3|nr:hypothetical protein [Psychromicrobium sp. YIM S02556]